MSAVYCLHTPQSCCAHLRSQNVASTSYSSSSIARSPAVRVHGRPVRCLTAQAAGSGDFSRKAQGFATDARKSAAEFMDKHRVQERAVEAGRQASQKFKETYEVVGDNVRRTAADVDAKFNVSEKAQQAAYKVREQAETLDTKLGVRRRLRILGEDVQRKMPLWRKQYNEFIRTPLGRVAFAGFNFYLVYSGLAVRLVQIVFAIMWLAPLLLIPVANRVSRRMAAEMQAAAAQQQQRAANPFANPFVRGQSRPSAGPQGRARPFERADAGPVIDAEWTTIDEGDSR